MKKFLAIAALFMAFTSSAFANSVTVEATHVKGQADAVAVVPSFDAYGFTVDGRLKASRSFGGLNTNDIEVRVGKAFAVTSKISATFRAGIGREYRTDSDLYQRYYVLPGSTIKFSESVPSSFAHTFYSVEPGVSYALTPKATLKFSDRYTNAFQDHVRYSKNHELGLEADYAVTKVDAVGVKYIHQHGDNNGKAVQLSYIRSF